MFIVFFAMALKDEAEMKEFNSVYSILCYGFEG